VDKNFSVNEREIKVLLKFSALEKSYLRDRSTSIDDDARLELDISYDINMLS
jgi:hypothetical protein